jgi:hypothetical protein
MAIKKISVSFDIDMDAFMKMLQIGNSGMHINVFGDTPKVPKMRGPKLLEAPERVGAKRLILNHLVKNKDRDVTTKELGELLKESKYAKGTHSSQLHMLVMNGFVRRGKDGYRPTVKGVNHVEG